ncbi:MAG: ATP-binding domain-containing protein, partial [Chthoniobacteraceae bacterium]|nr:ATP-binding domain-containing protein [Chthoniobacteraceae bacterium]
IIVPGYGILVLEVKSHTKVFVDERGWWLGADPQPDERGPFKQAADAMRAIRDYLIGSNSAFGATLFCFAACFPRMPFTMKSPSWQPWQSIDRQKLACQPISTIVLEILKSGGAILSANSVRAASQQSRYCSKEVVERIGMLLRPRFEQALSLKSLRKDLDVDLARFTDEQFVALDQMARNKRVIFSGPAGTGKSFLALEALKRVQQEYHPQRTALFCFNRLMGEKLEEQVEELCPGAIAGNFDAWLLKNITPRPTQAKMNEPGFWNGGLARLAVDGLLTQNSPATRFDFIVIDEAQDLLQPHYIEAIDLLLTGGFAAGRWRMFGDFDGQDIFAKGCIPLEKFQTVQAPSAAYFSLTVNCSNTTPISEYVVMLGCLKPPYSKVLRGDDHQDPHLEFYKGDGQQLEQVKSYIKKLTDDGFALEDIVLLSPLPSGSVGEAISREANWKSRIEPYRIAKSGKVRYTTIQKFKGLEAPAVILTDFSRLTSEHESSLFYIGLSRALHRLGIFLHEDLKPHIRSIT